MKIQKMALADGWYPQTKEACNNAIEGYAKNTNKENISDYLGAIVPHAGWYYSGKLAGQSIAQLSKNTNPDLVCVFGGHLMPEDNFIYYDVDAFETPLGLLNQDREIILELLKNPYLNFDQERWADNTVEIQLPIIKYFFPNSKIVAFRCPPSKKSIEFAKILTTLISEKNKKALFIGSTDLTHYGPNYHFTKFSTTEEAIEWVKNENDKNFIQYCINLDCDSLIKHANNNFSACSSGAAAACITAVKGLRDIKNGVLEGYYTSYDVRENSSFVGYAGLLF